MGYIDGYVYWENSNTPASNITVQYIPPQGDTHDKIKSTKTNKQGYFKIDNLWEDRNGGIGGTIHIGSHSYPFVGIPPIHKTYRIAKPNDDSVLLYFWSQADTSKPIHVIFPNHPQYNTEIKSPKPFYNHPNAYYPIFFPKSLPNSEPVIIEGRTKKRFNLGYLRRYGSVEVSFTKHASTHPTLYTKPVQKQKTHSTFIKVLLALIIVIGAYYLFTHKIPIFSSLD